MLSKINKPCCKFLFCRDSIHWSSRSALFLRYMREEQTRFNVILRSENLMGSDLIKSGWNGWQKEATLAR